MTASGANRSSLGATDLGEMLAHLDVEQRPESYTVVSGDWPGIASVAAASITEAQGTTWVVTLDQARALGVPVGFEAAWLTLSVHSSLEAVGLTAAVSRVLADRGIACNILAGFFHDHVLVPVGRADEAVAGLRSLRLTAVVDGSEESVSEVAGR